MSNAARSRFLTIISLRRDFDALMIALLPDLRQVKYGRELLYGCLC
ncbi:Uncharacterised protein [Salmonella enterica subsp. salamae]|uniref:Uncharacterized protein n=1 Tax=Salmonella enterica TaxID=28901 RepID=A0A379SEL3_SALER|nr:Uncharacterised protein [Salmonella enterica]SUJ08943.1 Uncharacterised protein [Salmonella enterica subsp. salamae]